MNKLIDKLRAEVALLLFSACLKVAPNEMVSAFASMAKAYRQSTQESHHD